MAKNTSTKLKPVAAKAALAPKPVTTHPHVISFRLSEAYMQKISDNFKAKPPTGVGSVKQLARKYVCDVLAGRATYRNPEHTKQDMDLIGA